MKKETIKKYLTFLADMSYKLWISNPDHLDFEQLQKEHCLFLSRLKNISCIDLSFVEKLHELGETCGMGNKPQGTTGIRFLSFVLPFGTGSIADGLSVKAIKLTMDEYYHGIMRITEEFETDACA